MRALRRLALRSSTALLSESAHQFRRRWGIIATQRNWRAEHTGACRQAISATGINDASRIHFLNLRPFHFCDVAESKNLNLSDGGTEDPIGQRRPAFRGADWINFQL